MSVLVRLVGSNGTQGEVETYDKTDRLWKPLCDDGWNLRSASVVCRQLNLGPPVSIYSHAATEVSYNYGVRESSEYYIESLTCEGTESSIVDCEYRDYSTYGCHVNETAGVACSPSKALKRCIIIYTYECMYDAFTAYLQSWESYCMKVIYYILLVTLARKVT